MNTLRLAGTLIAATAAAWAVLNLIIAASIRTRDTRTAFTNTNTNTDADADVDVDAGRGSEQ